MRHGKTSSRIVAPLRMLFVALPKYTQNTLK